MLLRYPQTVFAALGGAFDKSIGPVPNDTGSHSSFNIEYLLFGGEVAQTTVPLQDIQFRIDTISITLSHIDLSDRPTNTIVTFHLNYIYFNDTSH